MKKIIKRYFSSFAFFYSYLKNKVFIAFLLSIIVSFLDGLGLTMFFPLLQVVGDGGVVDGSEMGRMGYLIEAIEGFGISLTIGSVLIVMIIFFFLKGIATYISEVYIILLQQSFIRKVRLNLLSFLNKIGFKQFITSDVGRIQNTMSGEVDRVSIGFLAYFQTFQQATMVLVYLGFAFILNPQFAVLVAIGGGLTNFLYKYIYKRTKGASTKLTSYNSVFQGQIIQHVGHFKYLKATGRVNKYADKLRETIFKIEDSRRKIGVLASVAKAAREPMLITVIAIVILIQVKFLEGTMGTIIISLLFFYRALMSLTLMQARWSTFLEVSGSMDNMRNFQKELKSNTEKDGEIVFKEFTTGITLNKVSFSYDDTAILNNVQLEIKKNESVAFVGESGSGKTTLVSLIAGLMPQNKGDIFIDSLSLSDINKETYQNRIGYVSQDSVIFNDTIYNNITFWSPQTPENIARFERSIQQASLIDFLADLPQGRETFLGNNGINLSGGQKQRISIARELFKEIDILILDEATSALDSETEKAIQKSIDDLKGEYTILIVAHRLSTIRNADKIVFMDKGEIIDIDDFEGLVNKQTRFRKMVELQEI